MHNMYDDGMNNREQVLVGRERKNVKNLSENFHLSL